MEQSLQNLNKSAINNGVVLGVISMVLGILIFYVAPSLFGNAIFGIGNIVLLLVLYIVFTIDLRKKIGGFWNFKDAFKGIFLMAFIAGLVVAIFNYVFYNFIEPNGFQQIAGFVEEGTTSMLENMGMDQSAIDEQVEKQVEAMRAQFNPTGFEFFKNLGIQILIQVVMSLIFAAIFKKEAPVFAPVEDEA